jgi:hypothetical protein
MEANIHKTWNKLIHEIYAGARLQFIKGLFKPASIQLSYVMEYQMKYLGGIRGVLLKNRSKHKLLDIYNELVAEQMIEGLPISADFLEYASFWFNRYPSQITKSYDKWFQTYGAIAMDVGTLSYYDDFICILNEEIVRQSKDESNCLFTNAISDYDSYNSRIILQDNYHALSQYDTYMARLKKLKPSRYGIVSEEMDEQAFLEFKESGISLRYEGASIEAIAEIRKVGKFHLPTKENPTWTL